MRGYIDATIGDMLIGDTIIDPHSGVLCRIESIEPPNSKGLIVLNMRGSVSLSYMGLVDKPSRPIRRAPRASDAAPETGNEGAASPQPKPEPRAVSQRCACGIQSRSECLVACVK